MSGAIHSLPQYAFMAWCLVKKKHRDNFTFFYPLYSRLGGPQSRSGRNGEEPPPTTPIVQPVAQRYTDWDDNGNNNNNDNKNNNNSKNTSKVHGLEQSMQLT